VSSYRRRPVIHGAFACPYLNGRAGRASPASPVHLCRLRRHTMPDLLFVLLTLAVFVVLAVVVSGVEKL
jgi:hypothetical protein